jgi:outer membrane receptor protein involved in Fe transport
MNSPIPTRLRPTALAVLTALLALQAQADTPAPQTLERVEIVGTAPLPGAGVDRDKLPSNVQRLSKARIEEIGADNVADLLRRSVGSVNVVESQGNPYQMEVNFRGFTASPLLGQPQGLSVFLDGVRINEPFGDIVNWDLIPRGALASLTLIPGSNPVFGLNTLGGALSLTTRSGDTHPGTEIEASLGTFGRKDVEFAHGLKLADDLYLFIAADVFNDEGWRDHSPSDVRQLFVKLNGDSGPLDWALSFQGADNSLIGNGLLPESMLANGRSQVYTRPDQTLNRLAALTLRGGYDLGDGAKLEGQAYTRRLNAKTLNGDTNGDFTGTPDVQNGAENRSRTAQNVRGVALQWNHQSDGQLLTVGASHDRSHTTFEQTSALGTLDASRAVINVDPATLDAALRGSSRTSSVYASSSSAITPALTLTGSGRFNQTRVTTVDTGAAQGTGTALDGDQTFRAFNPALGAALALSPALTAYGNLSQGNRAPSPIELGCSDKTSPCVLPNAMQADPPLKQVISRSVEAGLRGRLDSGWRWNLGTFNTDNRNDILFVSAGANQPQAAGYFTNFGKTRRQGIEAGLSGRSGVFDATANLTLLKATYRSQACIVASANSSAGTSPNCPNPGEIEVRPGNRLPGLPMQQLKLDAGWRALPGVRLGANLQWQSDVIVRGNENQQHQPDGTTFFGSGKVDGFALLNLNANWKFSPGWTLLGKVNNVFDRHYSSGGLLGTSGIDSNGTALTTPASNWSNDQFVAPGAPRSFSLALQWKFND